jgi:hypothetical protein
VKEIEDAIKKASKTVKNDSGEFVTVPKSFVNSTIYDAFIASLKK